MGELLQTIDRKCSTSMFCFDKKKILMPNKMVVLLSTLHEDATVFEYGKSNRILNYNEIKSGVDTFDQLCSNIFYSQKTQSA